MNLNGFDGEVLLVACLCSLPCSLLGSVLFLMKKTMQIEAISHAVLLGIVSVFLLGLGSSLGAYLVGSCLAAFAAVQGSSMLENRLLFYKTSATALVYPALFAVAVWLLNGMLRNSHIDTHTVLLGELAFVGFERMEWNSQDLGPVAAWKAGSALSICLISFAVFARELPKMLFCSVLAHLSGAPTGRMRGVLLGCICFAAVAAMDVMGTVLTLSLFALPASSARLWTKRFWPFVCTTSVIGLIGVTGGYVLGLYFDVSLSGSIAVSLAIPLFISLPITQALTHKPSLQN